MVFVDDCVGIASIVQPSLIAIGFGVLTTEDLHSLQNILFGDVMSSKTYSHRRKVAGLQSAIDEPLHLLEVKC